MCVSVSQRRLGCISESENRQHVSLKEVKEATVGHQMQRGIMLFSAARLPSCTASVKFVGYKKKKRYLVTDTNP